MGVDSTDDEARSGASSTHTSTSRTSGARFGLWRLSSITGCDQGRNDLTARGTHTMTHSVAPGALTASGRLPDTTNAATIKLSRTEADTAGAIEFDAPREVPVRSRCGAAAALAI